MFLFCHITKGESYIGFISGHISCLPFIQQTTSTAGPSLHRPANIFLLSAIFFDAFFVAGVVQLPDSRVYSRETHQDTIPWQHRFKMADAGSSNKNEATANGRSFSALSRWSRKVFLTLLFSQARKG